MLRVNRWDQELNYEQTLEISRALALAHLDLCLGKPQDLYDAIYGRDWSTVCDWDVDYSASANVLDLIHIRQALGFFTKLEPLDIGKDKEQEARSKFLKTEVKCRETNAIFSDHDAQEGPKFLFSRAVEQVLYLAQRKISRLLGDVPSFNQLDFKFSPGATSSVPKHKSCARIKLSAVPSCTTNLLPNLPAFFREVPHWSALHASEWSWSEDEDWLTETVTVEITHGKLSFVPKNAKTYRTIGSEPTINGLIQGAYGRYIATKLRRVGQDIKDQTRNQRLAQEGSLTGALATLDLSSASDLISTGLVQHLLPYDWYVALSECRTPTFYDGDSLIHMAKFSSMGNGFTFPLQTLIFWSLVTSCAELREQNGTISVYGDDIICPVGAVPLVLEVFHSVGFEINTSKSYWDGPFRESCGADYFLGINIRPYYQRNLISGESLFLLHNYYVRTWNPEFAAKVLEYIDPSLRIWGPEGYGDGHLIGDWTPRPHKRSDGWGGYLFDTYTKIGRSHETSLPGDSVLPVYSIYARDSTDLGIAPEVWRNFNTGLYFCSGSEFRRFESFYLNPTRFNKRGVAVESLPGTSKGYKRIAIYTLLSR